MSELPWRCFHCNEVFTDREEAVLHFGGAPFDENVCQVSAADFRKLHGELARYREEDTELHREIARLNCEISRREQRAEEDGYARGLAAAKKRPELLGLRADHNLEPSAEDDEEDTNWPCACVDRDTQGNMTAIKMHPMTTKRCRDCGAEQPEHTEEHGV